MSEFKRWISYIYVYSGEIKGKNVGFAKIEARDGRCRLHINVKGAYGCDAKGLDVGFFVRREGRPLRFSAGKMRIREGAGEFCESTKEADLFHSGYSLSDCGGLWLTGAGKDTLYLTSWEKNCLDIRDFLERPEPLQTVYVSAAAMDTADDTADTAMEEAETAATAPQPQISLMDAGRSPLPRNMPVEKAAALDRSLDQLPRPGLWEAYVGIIPRQRRSFAGRGWSFCRSDRQICGIFPGGCGISAATAFSSTAITITGIWCWAGSPRRGRSSIFWG